MRQKILLLGGSYGQVPAIKEAKRRGLHTILCDYLPDNPGKEFADEFYLVSTTDKEKILEIALENNIDGILAYCSDPASLTSAYVNEKMGFRGNSFQSVELLTHKDLFRRFQKENQFTTPDFLVLSEGEILPFKRINALLPAVVKPVDSSDTKGVSLIKKMSELKHAMNYAFKFTKCDRIIIEEKIDCKTARLNGDGFVLDGELEFCQLGDHIFTSTVDPLKPSSTFLPSRIDQELLQRVEEQVAKQVKKSGLRFGPINIEVRINSKNDIYIMEIGPRNGGNYIPQAIHYSTGFNMLKALFDLILNEEVTIPRKDQKPCIIFTLHSNTKGIFKSFEIDSDIKPFLVEKNLFLNCGETVKTYDMPGSSLGSLIFSFDSKKVANRCAKDLYQKVIGGIRLQS